jgi:dihydroxyacetone kinase-like protein
MIMVTKVRNNLTATDVLTWQRIYGEALAAQKEYLSDLDSPIGDADHGINMNRGYAEVAKILPDLDGEDIGTILKKIGMTLIAKVGGAAGPLYGTFFLRAGGAVPGLNELSTETLLTCLRAGLQGVKDRGRAEAGDKTMVDSIAPALEALGRSVATKAPLLEAVREAEAAARAGMKATIPMVARKGRASYLSERSAGHQDPGATSSALLFTTLLQVLEAKN